MNAKDEQFLVSHLLRKCSDKTERRNGDSDVPIYYTLILGVFKNVKTHFPKCMS